jgi:hypoxanthine phosphoribosyltransferase
MVSTPPELLSSHDIQHRVASLAADIDRTYAGTGTLVLIGVLKGSFIFLSDLARKLAVPHRVEFIAVTSYGAKESENADPVRLIMDVRHGIGGQDVLIVEDIVDTGHTLAYLKRLFIARDPRSLRTCSLLFKPARTEQDVDIDFLGFSIPDVWVVGYGLDYAERYRTLPYIAELPAEMR